MSHSRQVIQAKGRPRVCFRERAIVLTASLTMAYSAWGLGGIPVWSLHVLLVGGSLTLAIAVMPLPQRGERGEHRSLRTSPPGVKNIGRLLRWPPFYFSLAVLLYLFIAALNPMVELVRNERGWWVEAIQPGLAGWLPGSVRANYEPMNAWRVLASFTAAFALIWGLRAGITRRGSLLCVLWTFLLSGAAMGFVAILQHLSGAETVLWHFASSNENFWGSFFYRNQGAAYLNLVLVAAGVLYFYHAHKSRERARSGGPHFLCFLLFAVLATSVGLALSRGGILFAAILSLAFLALVALYSLQGIAHLHSLWIALIPIAVLGLGAFTLVSYVDLDAIETRFGDIEATLENADEDARAMSTRATWDMAQDRLWQGWGPGSFRYIFPIYQKNYPELFYARYHNRKEQWVGRRMYRYAHNDIVQFVAEYGLIGTGLILLTLLWILLSAFRLFSYSAFFLLLGFAAIMSHAFFDFIFNSPAYWLAFVGLLAASAQLLHLEAQRIRSGSR